jgi:hypothetical protein
MKLKQLVSQTQKAMSRENNQTESFERFRNKVLSWAEARNWPRLRDRMGFLISRSGKEEWIHLIEHVRRLSPESQGWVVNRILIAMGLQHETTTKQSHKKKRKSKQ